MKESKDKKDIKDVSEEVIDIDKENTKTKEPLSLSELERLRQEERVQRLILMAEMENLRKRVEIDRIESAKYRSHSFLISILSTLDMFELALKNVNISDELKNYLKGFEMIYSNLLKALEEEGVKIIDINVGDEFDPKYFYAIEEVETNKVKPGRVFQIMNKGYILHDRLLRPTTVKVAKNISKNNKEIKE